MKHLSNWKFRGKKKKREQENVKEISQRDHVLDKKSCQLCQPKKETKDTPNSTEVSVVSMGKSLKIEPFKIPEHTLEVGRAWREWIEDFEDKTSYFEITEIRDHLGALKIYGGKEIKKLAHNLPDTAPVVGDDDYKKLKRKLDHHFLPKKNKEHYRYTLTNKSKSKERVFLHT